MGTWGNNSGKAGTEGSSIKGKSGKIMSKPCRQRYKRKEAPENKINRGGGESHPSAKEVHKNKQKGKEPSDVLKKGGVQRWRE